MNFNQLYEALTGIEMQSGSYVAMKLSDSTIGLIESLQKQLGLKNPVPVDKLHITLMYSLKPLNSTFTCSTKSIIGDGECSFQMFGPEQDCLVLKLSGNIEEKLKTRHNEIASYGGEHTYNPYQPHITLSYGEPEQFRDQLQNNIRNVIGRTYSFAFVSEYHEPVDNSWSDSMKK